MKKVTFVISETRLHEQLSIMALSASLKSAGHEVSLLYLQGDPLNKGKVVDELERETPDLIALSFMSCMQGQYLELADRIKQSMDVPIMIGGPAATFDRNLADIKDSPFDAVCVGEGDIAIRDFVDGYNGSLSESVSNFIVMSESGERIIGDLAGLVDPLDQLPFPDRKIIYDSDDFLRNSKIKMFMSGRGCPYKCTYCFNHKYNEMYRGKGRIVRHKTVDYFLEEIERVKKQYPLEGIIFEDDIFIMNKSWLAEFARKYPRRIGLPYMCHVRPNLVTEDVAILLRQSGCHSVRVAIECGNEVLRNEVLKRNLRDEQILKSCLILHGEGIKVGTINILGLPTETVDDMKLTLKLNRDCEPEHVSANMFIPLPGVELTSYAIDRGFLDEKFASPKSTHHISEMRYPADVKAFLYPFKALFPMMAKYPAVERAAPLLMKLPWFILRIIDSSFRLYSNSRFYPPVDFSFMDKWRAFRRFVSLALR